MQIERSIPNYQIIMENVRVAVIGTGNMGYTHAKKIYEGKVVGMTLAAVCDTDEEKRNKDRESFPSVPVFSDYRELLSAHICDAVIIAVPHYLHPVIAVDAFREGYHVLTEKPAGVDTADVVKMNEEAKKSGRVFGIMFNQRTDPLFIKAREMVRNGEIGLPKRLQWTVTNWYRTQHYYDSGDWRATWKGEGGGVLLNQAPHNLDLWQWIFGMPQRIKAECNVAKYHNIEVEDEAVIFAEYDNGATATFITSTGEFPGTNRLEIVGDRGKIVLEDGKLKFWKLAEAERKVCFESEENFAKIGFEYSEYIPEKKGKGHTGILENFASAILGNEPMISPGYDGICQLTISNAAYLSAWTGKTVTLPLTPEEMTEFSSELEKRKKLSAEKTADSNKHFSPTGEYSDRWRVNW